MGDFDYSRDSKPRVVSFQRTQEELPRVMEVSAAIPKVIFPTFFHPLPEVAESISPSVKVWCYYQKLCQCVVIIDDAKPPSVSYSREYS